MQIQRLWIWKSGSYSSHPLHQCGYQRHTVCARKHHLLLFSTMLRYYLVQWQLATSRNNNNNNDKNPSPQQQAFQQPILAFEEPIFRPTSVGYSQDISIYRRPLSNSTAIWSANTFASSPVVAHISILFVCLPLEVIECQSRFHVHVPESFYVRVVICVCVCLCVYATHVPARMVIVCAVRCIVWKTIFDTLG